MKYEGMSMTRHPFSPVFTANILNRRLRRCVIGRIDFKQKEV